VDDDVSIVLPYTVYIWRRCFNARSHRVARKLCHVTRLPRRPVSLIALRISPDVAKITRRHLHAGDNLYKRRAENGLFAFHGIS